MATCTGPPPALICGRRQVRCGCLQRAVASTCWLLPHACPPMLMRWLGDAGRQGSCWGGGRAAHCGGTYGRPSPVWRAGERLPQSQLTDSQPPAHIHGDDLRQAPSSSRCCLMPTPVQLPCGHPPPPCGAAGAAALWPTLPCLPLLLLLLPLAQRVPTQQARGRGRTLSAASLSE